jgi:hypothetical protein
MPSLLNLSYNNELKREINATKHMGFYAMLLSRYQPEPIAYVM